MAYSSILYKKKGEALDQDKNQALVGKMLSKEDVIKIIPHRDPMLMIDKVKIIEDAKKAVGYKFVSGKEDFFRGHFPGHPIMPGVLIIEAMAQTACVLFLSRPDLKNKLAFFMTIENAKFRKPVIPGMALELRIDVLRVRDRGGKIRGEAYVNNELVTESEFMFVLTDRN
jgi:beta-hydroxyacyl-ACP dehydratase FabZ